MEPRSEELDKSKNQYFCYYTGKEKYQECVYNVRCGYGYLALQASAHAFVLAG